VIVVEGAAYMKANSAFWTAQGERGAGALLGDKWVRLPAGATTSFASLLALTDPAKLGRCLLRTHVGTITKKGTEKLDGKPVVVLADKGDVPGGTPGLLYIAASGSPLPVRAVQTGRQSSGGKPDASCGETDEDVNDTSTDADLRFSNYNEEVEIEAPKDAVDLDSLQGSSAA
jgi:hypothetical protein